MALGQAVATGVTTAALASNPLGWLVGGAMVLGDLFSGSAEKEAARNKMSYISDQQSGVQKALGEIPEIAGMKTELAEDVYGLGLGRSMFGTGKSLFGLTRQGMETSADVGFARSGQVQQALERGERHIVADFGIQRKGLQAQLGESLMGITEWQSGQEGQLQSELSRLDYEYKAASQTANKGFLESLFT